MNGVAGSGRRILGTGQSERRRARGFRPRQQRAPCKVRCRARREHLTRMYWCSFWKWPYPRPESGLDWLICSKSPPRIHWHRRCETRQSVCGLLKGCKGHKTHRFENGGTNQIRKTGSREVVLLQPLPQTLYAIDGCFGDLIVRPYLKTHVRAQVLFSPAHTTLQFPEERQMYFCKTIPHPHLRLGAEPLPSGVEKHRRPSRLSPKKMAHAKARI